MRHPETDPNDGQQEEQVDQIRVRHRFQQLIEAAEVVSLDPGMGGLQRVAAAPFEDLPAVEVSQQRVEVAAFEVDDAQLHSLVRGRIDALPDCLLHPIGVVVVKGGQRTAVGGRVVLDLLVLDVGDRSDHAVEGGYQHVRLGRASCHGRQKPNYGDGREKEATGPLHDLMIARAERAGLRRMNAWRNAQNRDLPMAKKPITEPSWLVTHACPTTKSDASSTPRARAATPPTAG